MNGALASRAVLIGVLPCDPQTGPTLVDPSLGVEALLGSAPPQNSRHQSSSSLESSSREVQGRPPSAPYLSAIRCRFQAPSSPSPGSHMHIPSPRSVPVLQPTRSRLSQETATLPIIMSTYMYGETLPSSQREQHSSKSATQHPPNRHVLKLMTQPVTLMTIRAQFQKICHAQYCSVPEDLVLQ